jgi:hypothetical protein
MANKDLIRYDLLVQDALKGVVRRVLIDAGKDGLPGEHHFYISFRTDFPGVRISNRLRDKYPQEMTVVMQHQFWDLIITEHTFEVGLSFSGVPERLLIPFDALTGFFDPSVQFGLKFDSPDGEEDDQDLPPQQPEKARNGADPVALKAPPKAQGADKKADTKMPQVAPESASSNELERPGKENAPVEADANGTAQVVSLDAFRKKN